MTLPDEVLIRDVGPRDGLQPEAPVAPERRVELIEHLIAAGISHIELGAFVSPKAVPAMAGAAEIFASVPARPGLVRTALVPNLRGAQLALEAGAEALTVTLSASETYNQRNVQMSTEQSVAVIGEIAGLAGEGSVPVDAVISCAFGSPYEGEILPTEVRDLALRLTDADVTRTYADTTGMATPRRIDELLDVLDGPLGEDLGLHLHDTRGMALVNTWTALARGVRRFDTSVGGLGGSPFAHGAGGNLATETLVALLDDVGVKTGVDIERLIEAALLVEDLVGRPVPSGVAHQGPRTRRATGS